MLQENYISEKFSLQECQPKQKFPQKSEKMQKNL